MGAAILLTFCVTSTIAIIIFALFYRSVVRETCIKMSKGDYKVEWHKGVDGNIRHFVFVRKIGYPADLEESWEEV